MASPSRSGQPLPAINGRGFGDMVIEIEVETPTRLSARQREILEAFRETETGEECPASKSFFGKLKSLFEAEFRREGRLRPLVERVERASDGAQGLVLWYCLFGVRFGLGFWLESQESTQTTNKKNIGFVFRLWR